MIVNRLALPALVPLALFLTDGTTAQPTVDVVGIWSNPKGSVYVRTERCGDRLCGEIVCATPRAVAKAKAKGTEALVGTKLFDDLRHRDDGSWRGKILVPDRGSRFQSTLRPLGDDRLEVRGCAVAGFICKQQVWSRADARTCERRDQGD